MIKKQNKHNYQYKCKHGLIFTISSRYVYSPFTKTVTSIIRAKLFSMNIYRCLQIVYFEFLFLHLNYRELIFIMLSQMFVISSLQDSVSGMRLSIHLEKIITSLSTFIESGMSQAAISLSHFSMTISLLTFSTAKSKQQGKVLNCPFHIGECGSVQRFRKGLQ